MIGLQSKFIKTIHIMSIRETILKLALTATQFSTADVVKLLKNQYSRQSVALELRKLVSEGRLIKGGSTRGSFYLLPDNINKIGSSVEKKLINKNLEEHEVFNDIKKQSIAIKNLQENVYSIVEYSFDEMFNNAIEHSGSKNIEVNAREQLGIFSFEIKDRGIGVFRNLMEKRHLKSELEAIQDLLKGKITTSPHAHSGEGIFFTSKAVDIFVLESFGWRLRVDNLIKDVFVEEIKSLERGTKVKCSIATDSNRHLNEIFERYQTNKEEMAFDKTEVRIKLFAMGTIYISRSQARRVLLGLEKFKTVIMDFDRVPTIGQAFADEIFRVFLINNPKINIVPTNMNKAVEFMVKRVEKP